MPPAAGSCIEVYLPGALPLIFTGLKLSLQASWTTLVAAELVGAFVGLGRVLSTAYRDINTSMILVAMVMIAILGALTTKAPDLGRAAGDPLEDAVTPRRHHLWLYSAASLLLFFGLWQGAVSAGLVSSFVLPSPVEVAARIWTLMVRPFAGFRLYEHLLSSFGRFLGGFLLAAIIGIPLGLLMGRFRLLDEIVTPLFEGYRYVAPLAWVPFAALWFGTGLGGPILVIFTGAFAPCVVNAYRGARLVDTYLIEAAQTHGASELRIAREVLLPGALPSIVAGLRIAAGLGWQSLIGAELIVVSFRHRLRPGPGAEQSQPVHRDECHGDDRPHRSPDRLGVAGGRAARECEMGRPDVSDIRFEGISKRFSRGDGQGVRRDWRNRLPCRRPRVHLGRRAFGLRQDHADAHGRRAGNAERRPDHGGGPGGARARPRPCGRLPAVRALSLEDGARETSSSACARAVRARRSATPRSSTTSRS